MLRILIYSFFINFLSLTNLESQQVSILLQGNLIDYETRNPIEVELRIKDKNGNIITGNSNAIDGKYQVVLKSGNEYEINFIGYVSLQNNIIKVPDFNKYEELTKNFELIKLKPGISIKKINIFEKNSDKLNNQVNELINFIKSLNESQKSIITYDFILSADDSEFKVKNEKIKFEEKGKIKVKNVKLSENEQAEKLIDLRKTQLQKIFEENKLPIRYINFQSKPYTKLAKKQTTNKGKDNINQENYNLEIKLNKITRL